MKKIGILLLFAALFVSSCAKDKATKIAPGTSAEIDGTTWKATDVQASENDGVLVIEAKDTEGKTVVIRTDGTHEGTYNLDANGNFCTFKTNGKFFAVHPGSEKPCGKVVIENFQDGHCSGFFEFNAYDENNQVVSCQKGSFGDVTVSTAHNHHAKCGLFSSKVEDKYCASENISCQVDGDHIKIHGTCASGKTVSFKCPAHVGVGEYSVGPWGGGSVSCDYTGSGFNFGSFNANCGTFKITKHDEEKHIIEGEFHMNLVSFGPFGAGANFQHGSFTTQY